MSPNSGADGSGYREGGGQQGPEAEGAEQESQEAVVALRFVPRLLPGGDFGDLVGTDQCHRLLHGEVGVLGIGKAKADRLPDSAGVGFDLVQL